jgi:cytochrome c5
VASVAIDPNAPAPTPVAAAAIPAAATKAEAGGGGKATYESTCKACHDAGIAGAPKFGDKAAWSARLKGGKDALYASALKGKGAMPPKGGNLSLPEADIKAAVDYIVSAAK